MSRGEVRQRPLKAPRITRGPKAAPAPVLARRFVRAPGAIGITDEDAPVIGRELDRIAEMHKIGSARALDPRLVWDAVKRDKASVLRKFYNWNPREAAEAHWLDRTRQIMRSVRLVEVDLGSRERHVAPWEYAEVSVVTPKGVATRRTHVDRRDLLRNDPAFMSALGFHLKRITDSLAKYEDLVSSRDSPSRYVQVARGLRTVMDDFYAELDQEAAE
jgi:hypothetical protein